uniref:CDK5 regulatory subunit-associated protein 3 n=1 Tax=Wuchereria bancrofti TaxID=6293 RepID=A0A1I8EMG1_WUCBA
MLDEKDIPIDIHSSKLLDWLLSRRHCNKDWQKNVMIIREKISAAIRDMPEDERIVKLLQGSYINYFHCARIVNILKDTEKGTKNFLGYYSSQRMNDWMSFFFHWTPACDRYNGWCQIQQMYEKGNIHLAEAAQILQRMVQYEIPVLKKQISKCDQTITDCIKKEKDYAKQMVDGKKQYEKELWKLGIEAKLRVLLGVHLKREIISLLTDLPSFLDEMTKSISSLNEPLQYYEQFQAYLHQNKTQNVVLLPLCRLLMEKGAQVTVYEWKNGVKPVRIELPSLDAWLNEEVNNAEEIDFGNDLIIPDDEIDFGDSKFQIEVVGDEIGDANDGIARGLDALTILENSQTRNLIYFELRELEKFLVIRREDETIESVSDIYILGIEERPEALKKVTVEKIDKWSMHVSEIINKLIDTQKANLFRIRSSPHHVDLRYVEKLVETLEQKRSLEGRYEKMRDLMIEKQSEMRISMQKAHETLNGICEASKLLKKKSQKYIREGNFCDKLTDLILKTRNFQEEVVSS